MKLRAITCSPKPSLYVLPVMSDNKFHAHRRVSENLDFSIKLMRLIARKYCTTMNMLIFTLYKILLYKQTASDLHTTV